MLKWIDLFELMGYVTAMFSVSVSYASKLQEAHYSDFLKQNEHLRNYIFSPLMSMTMMVVVGIYLAYFIACIATGRVYFNRSRQFSIIYIVFLGLLAEVLLWHLEHITFTGAPMLILAILMVFIVEVKRAYKVSEDN